MEQKRTEVDIVFNDSAFPSDGVIIEMLNVIWNSLGQQRRCDQQSLVCDLVPYNHRPLTHIFSAGTSALKGDFTRTGKRDLAGMLNDGINSISRYPRPPSSRTMS
jgi:hypothetical protein